MQTDWDCHDGGQLLDSIYDLSELPVPRAVCEANLLFQVDSDNHWYRTRELPKGVFNASVSIFMTSILPALLWFSALGFKPRITGPTDPENTAKKLAIIKWCSGVEHHSNTFVLYSIIDETISEFPVSKK
ncbi:hypothetical protein BJ138DRAFT_1107102 [Hygrophoropsis aurantiaca]|uniref:Uncharacterized protein n=1 Tax=Hygrophoropsis aurantiaca TaxID=72124 RepID=A0ACB7ZSQ1_9AGAM|nr:hypothetical protein BJ138DRAFT_1107102 [Hygrophoropsis aurantiaca]